MKSLLFASLATLSFAKLSNAACGGAYSQCGGANFQGEACCASGYQCVKLNEWYSNCQPGGSSDTANNAAPVSNAADNQWGNNGWNNNNNNNNGGWDWNNQWNNNNNNNQWNNNNNNNQWNNNNNNNQWNNNNNNGGWDWNNQWNNNNNNNNQWNNNNNNQNNAWDNNQNNGWNNNQNNGWDNNQNNGWNNNQNNGWDNNQNNGGSNFDWNNNGQAQSNQAPANNAPAAGGYAPASGFKFYSQCNNPSHWAMTYDDGPTEFADDILDLLKEKGIKATFFIVGHMYMQNTSPDWSRIIKRMYNEGHTVGNHTYDHEDLTNLSSDQIKNQMKQVEDLIYQAIGKKPAFMRPPYGSGNGNQNVMSALQQAGYTAAITWNVDPMDYNNGGDANYAKQVINQAKGQPIITLNHLKYNGATKEGILALARAEIETMLANGYTSVNMEECLGISGYQ